MVFNFQNKRLILVIAAVLVSIGLFLPFFINISTNKEPVNSEGLGNAGKVSGTKIETNSSIPSVAKQLVKVTRVIDGDTIEIEGGQKIRYIGINTPETVDPQSPVQCFGSEATFKNRELVEGRAILIEKDVSETDKYRRLLRYVYIGDIFVNEYLVRQGFAYASTFPPDVKYQEQLRQAEQEARQNQKGLWGQCPKDDQKQSTSNQTVPDSDCQIKGNISASGEKIYHLPGQRYYDKTVIDESRGERWFCSEEEAQNAGWRKSKI